MDAKLLPRYRGLPDTRKAWREPDEQGNMPVMRLRDYAVLVAIIFLGGPINLPLLVRCRMCHRDLVVQNSSRHELLWNRQFEP